MTSGCPPKDARHRVHFSNCQSGFGCEMLVRVARRGCPHKGATPARVFFSIELPESTAQGGLPPRVAPFLATQPASPHRFDPLAATQPASPPRMDPRVTTHPLCKNAILSHKQTSKSLRDDTRRVVTHGSQPARDTGCDQAGAQPWMGDTGSIIGRGWPLLYKSTQPPSTDPRPTPLACCPPL